MAIFRLNVAALVIPRYDWFSIFVWQDTLPVQSLVGSSLLHALILEVKDTTPSFMLTLMPAPE